MIRQSRFLKANNSNDWQLSNSLSGDEDGENGRIKIKTSRDSEEPQAVD